MATTIELKNSVTTGNSPSTLAQGEMGVNITDKKVWIGNASSTPIQLIGAGASMSLTSLTTSSDASISGLTVGKGGGSVGGATVFGRGAMAATNTGSYNTAIGDSSLAANTSGGFNTGTGSGTLTANTTGSYNTANGQIALFLNTTGSNNTAVGFQAGYSNTTGAYNTFLGWKAGYTSAVSSSFAGNVCLGEESGLNLSTGKGNCIVGSQAGLNLTTGSKNTFIGSTDNATNFSSGYYITTGSSNSILGNFSGNSGGLDIRTASNYIVLSDGDGNPRGVFDASGNFGIGVASPNTSSPTTGVAILTGNYAGVGVGHISGTPSGYYYASFAYNGSIIGTISQAGTTGVLYNVTSDYRLKDVVSSISDSGSRIDALQPINYTMKSDGSAQRGFLAHQFQAIYANSVSGQKDAVDAEGKPIYQAMQASTSEVMADLIAEIQSLRKRVALLESK